MNVSLLAPTGSLSAIVPVLDRHDDPEAVFTAYAAMLRATGRSFEMIYVLDGEKPAVSAALRRFEESGQPLTVIRFNQSFGEAACIREGVRRAQGYTILLLPAFLQVEPADIPRLLDRMGEADVVVAARDRHGDQPLHRLRGWGFERLARIAGSRFEDPGCTVGVVRRHVFDELTLQDEQHRFLPLLAERLGFRVEQVELPQAAVDRKIRLHRPGFYLGIGLDLLSISFLLRFLQKPFRFFGTVGAVTVALGLVLGCVLAFERYVLGIPLAERPLLLLTALLIVLGLQIAAVGLIAEIIIFTRSTGSSATYHIQRIVERADGARREKVHGAS